MALVVAALGVAALLLFVIGPGAGCSDVSNVTLTDTIASKSFANGSTRMLGLHV
jgi:hypothetical protein